VSAATTFDTPLRNRRAMIRAAAIILVATLAVLAMGKHILIDGTDWSRTGGAVILKTVLYFVPDLAFFPKTVLPLLETLLIAFWGTTLAIVMAVPVAYLAAKNITPHYPATYALGRLLIVLSRSTHEIIFALLYVSALGLGPLPGIMALASRSVGFLAKTTAEAIENVDRGPIEAIEATGAGQIKVFLFGVAPQIYPIVIGNLIFQLDINLRRAAILGLVGGGGIGLLFAELMQRIEYDKAGTVVMGVTGMVIIGEYISNRIRARVL
jgi:phosphonate transport system permease protein